MKIKARRRIKSRPLSIRKNETWYSYGQDLTKNVTELYKADGTIASTYDYTPYGSVTATGIDQPLQWSSEVYDSELGMVYYNYRHYNPRDGRWINRDPIAEQGGWNLYGFVGNNPVLSLDYLGKNDFPDMDWCRPMAVDAYMICLARQNWKPEPLERCFKQCSEEYNRRSRQIDWITKQAVLANSSVNAADISKWPQVAIIIAMEIRNEILHAHCKKKCRDAFGFPFPHCA